MSDIVYTLQNNQKLNASQFRRYIYKKIGNASKKFNKTFDLTKKINIYCLDDAAIDIIYSLMSGKKAIIRKTPFLFCLKRELELCAKLRNLKFKFIAYKGLKKEVSNMLDELEKRHKEIKYSVVRAHFQMFKS